MRTVGKYSVSGNRLTLKQTGGGETVYTISLSADGQLMTLIAGDGSGYKAERTKK